MCGVRAAIIVSATGSRSGMGEGDLCLCRSWDSFVHFDTVWMVHVGLQRIVCLVNSSGVLHVAPLVTTVCRVIEQHQSGRIPKCGIFSSVASLSSVMIVSTQRIILPYMLVTPSTPVCDSLLNDNENGSCPDNMSRMATPQLTRVYPLDSPLASSPTEMETTPACSSRGIPTLGSTTDHEKYIAKAGLEGDKERWRVTAEAPPPLQGFCEALPVDIDVSWRGDKYRDDYGAIVSARRSATSPGAEKKDARTSPRSRPSSSFTTTAIALNSAAHNPSALGASDHSSPAVSVFGGVASKAHLFASPFSTLGDGDPVTHHYSPALHGGASSTGAVGRSPTSARVDILQNLLAPTAMGEQDLMQQKTTQALSAGAEEKKCNGTDFSTSATTAVLEAIDSGGNVVVTCGESTDDADALERLVGHSIIAGGTSSSTRSDNGSPTINAVSSFVDGIARPAINGPAVGVGSSSYRPKATETSLPQTTESQRTSRPTQSREGFDVRASARALDCGHGPSVDNEGGATARMFNVGERRGNGDRGERGLMQPSSDSARSEGLCGGQKAGPRITMDERPDELEELEVRVVCCCKQHEN